MIENYKLSIWGQKEHSILEQFLLCGYNSKSVIYFRCWKVTLVIFLLLYKGNFNRNKKGQVCKEDT